jgi:hypothetical protein
LLYAIPRASVLGAILLTGYLGGAVLINMRVGSPLFRQTLFPGCGAAEGAPFRSSRVLSKYSHFMPRIYGK